MDEVKETQEVEKSTDEVMSEIFDQLLGEEPENVVEDDEVDDKTEISGETDESGETEEVEESTEGKEEEESEEQKELVPGSLEPIKRWPEETKEAFGKLPEDSQKAVLEMFKGFQADYTRKSQNIAETTRALDPLRPLMQKANMSESQAVRQLVGVYSQLLQNPVQGIKTVMKNANLDLETLSNYWDSPDEFAEEKGTKLDAIERRLDQNELTKQQENLKQLDQQIKDWSADKEFFSKVDEKMAELSAAAGLQGKEKSFDELYEDACWLVPEVRDEIKKRADAKALGDSVEEKKKRTAKAKRASKSIKQSSTSVKKKGPESPKSTEEAMEKAWNEQIGKGVA